MEEKRTDQSWAEPWKGKARWGWHRGIRAAACVAFPIGAAVLLLGHDLLHQPTLEGRLVTAAFMVLNLVYVGGWLVSMGWPCPRCGKPFMFRWWRNLPFHRHCQHCGLEYGSEPPPQPDAPPR